MKKVIFFLIIALAGFHYTQAQTMGSVFKSIPDDVLLGLEMEEKEELISEANDSLVIVGSAIFTQIKRLNYTENFMFLQTSDSSTLQLKLLSLINDSKIIAVIRTVCAPACDSQINFYTPAWKKVNKNELFPAIDLNWFFKADADKQSEAYMNMKAALDIDFVKLNMSAVDDNVEVVYDIKSYLTSGEYKNVEPFFEEATKKLIWDKVSFK